MKLVMFSAGAAPPRVGVLQEDVVVDLRAGAPDLPPTIAGLLAAGASALATAARVGVTATAKKQALPLAAVKLHAPIPRPGKILCSGINYHGHFAENPSARMPSEPFFFAKMPSTVIGPGESILKPRQTEQLDYEVELAVVIGSRLTRAVEAEVMHAVAGYTILHDVSARDVQFKDNQITLGKNFDTFCPIGPCVVTADEILTPHNVKLRSFVNGRVMQDGSTADWVFPLPRLLSFLSSVMTLEPGDIVSTGTPAGVGLFQKPPRYLQPGDVVRLEIDGIGALENPIVAVA